MSTEPGKGYSDKNVVFARRRLFERMMSAKESGNGREVSDALAEAKAWLAHNHVGDNAIRDAQRQLLTLPKKPETGV
jgi:hypothetical protein